MLLDGSHADKTLSEIEGKTVDHLRHFTGPAQFLNRVFNSRAAWHYASPAIAALPPFF
jgi:hypothetical protein